MISLSPADYAAIKSGSWVYPPTYTPGGVCPDSVTLACGDKKQVRTIIDTRELISIVEGQSVKRLAVRVGELVR